MPGTHARVADRSPGSDGWRRSAAPCAGRVASWYEALVFGGRLLEAAGIAWRSLKRLRVPSVVRHMHETGVQAMPVVSVIALLISVISAYIGAQQLRPFGAEIYTVDLVAIGVLRELGVLLTAIMVAGRTGSAYAAELGVMKLNDEVDALESMGMNPYEVLVLPRVRGAGARAAVAHRRRRLHGPRGRCAAHQLPDRPAVVRSS